MQYKEQTNGIEYTRIQVKYKQEYPQQEHDHDHIEHFSFWFQLTGSLCNDLSSKLMMV